MPGILYEPHDRRSFLKLTSLGAIGLLAGCASPGSQVGAGAEAEFHLALLSDTHIPADPKNGYRGFTPGENLAHIVPDVVAARPDGVILNGDAARLEGKQEDYAELKRLLAPVAGVAPIYIGMGNHDDRENFFKVFPTRGVEGKTVGDKHVVVIEHAVARIVVLDSLLTTNKTPGFLGQKQRQWLADYLNGHRDRPVIVFVHHTLGDADGELLDAERLFRTLRPFKHVKSIFYGHSHVWSQTDREGLKLVNLPAVGYNFQDKDPVGWVDARFRKHEVRLTLHAIAGNRAQDGRELTVRWG